MLSHRAIWDGIDALARRHGHSVSALAKLAGLDATAFNVSKRISKDGRERWPSTESISKILEATGESFDSFLTGSGAFLQLNDNLPNRTVPLLGLAQAGTGGFFDSAGFPAGQGWDEIDLPSPGEGGIYALEVQGDSMEPLYREGDRIVVSPTEQVRRGDRVVVKSREGEVMAKILFRQTGKQIELHSLNPAYAPRIFDLADIEWIARIIWASQ
ncbi:MAG: helix-turn-helix transcriptional regulator [Alphaproteobacteria bacterium]|jgi:phage repressor protein C with HTH and peptisase S24 domain|nr:helix-turn-helix transcriptional regulator [Alphaproteobacteria bacterium]MBU1562916.1 helix-turn-helix transcriptional regulator [Alphaproteobacteria bacterium]MBU2303104.1 helix-turn-helix transcriptional regulator [Alphaproteobacteria bacterium]MBU2368493.1 helix-turn-helix transcriptional regulator [Alphaproteobacteria bacterium]